MTGPARRMQVVEAKINKRMFIKNRSASLLRRGTIVSITCSLFNLSIPGSVQSNVDSKERYLKRETRSRR